MKKTALVLAAAAALGTLGLSWSAQALPLGSGAPTVEKQTKANIETVSHRRHWRGHRWRHRHHDGDGWRYGGAFLGGVLIGSALNNAYYDDYYDDPPPRRYGYRVADDHVAYCLDRYRSYDVETDSFLGYDGYRHRCNSPYD
jgi:hypothetical protein